MRKSHAVTSVLKRSANVARKAFTTSPIRCAEPENLQYYARKKQTNVSLKALMETGNGKFIEDFKGGMQTTMLDDASSNEKILIQVINNAKLSAQEYSEERFSSDRCIASLVRSELPPSSRFLCC